MPKTYEYNKKYVKTYMAKFERIGIKVPKGKRELLKSYAEKHSESVNELINRLIDAELGGERQKPEEGTSMIQPQAVRVDIYDQVHRRRRTYWVYLTSDGQAFLDAIDAYTHAYNNRVSGRK